MSVMQHSELPAPRQILQVKPCGTVICPLFQLALLGCVWHVYWPEMDWTVQVREEAVAELHAQYYAEVEKLYRKHSQTFPGYKDMRLIMF